MARRSKASTGWWRRRPGFTVVADEVRKLAESASVQAKASKEVLTEIQQVILEVKTASSEAAEVFSSISGQVPGVVALFQATEDVDRLTHLFQLWVDLSREAKKLMTQDKESEC